jgi:hypothetical protein
LPIWTQDALRSETTSYSSDCWRLVEAQHINSTRKLVDSDDEQTRLEDLIENTKQSVPDECRELDYLLFTPFRYDSAYPAGSRFRRSGQSPGVFYASEWVETAVSEIAFYRLLFFAESPDTEIPTVPFNFTAFSVGVADTNMIDLTSGLLVSDQADWFHLTDYSACQKLADNVRAIGSKIIRYQSVRDPKRGHNLAVLRCSAFTVSEPKARQSWQFLINKDSVAARREFPSLRLEFPRKAFMRDPRLQSVNWANK